MALKPQKDGGAFEINIEYQVAFRELYFVFAHESVIPVLVELLRAKIVYVHTLCYNN